MKQLPVIIGVLLVLAGLGLFVWPRVSAAINRSRQEERLYQRFLLQKQPEMAQLQKLDPADFNSNVLNSPQFQAEIRAMFHAMIVDPSFGIDWDEVPAPTLTGPGAMSAVDAFIASYGWNMQTNDNIFDNNSAGDDTIHSQPIRGLPWSVIHDTDFPAVTHNGILYVYFRGFHHDGHGVAYNPNTNRFSPAMNAFKPIGQHWYAWQFDHEFPAPKSQPQQYEGGGEPAQATSPAKSP